MPGEGRVVYVRGYVKSSTRGIIKKNDGGWVTHDDSDVHIGGGGEWMSSGMRGMR